VVSNNKLDMERYHLGKEIKREVERRGIRIASFADQLCYNRANVYNIFKREHMDTELLARISRILHRNFLEEVSRQIELW